MDRSEKRNQNLMAIIKRMHEVIEETDVNKARASQEHVAKLNILSKDLTVTEVNIDNIYCEWIRPDRPHNKRYIILYCHGGGYSTGSASYARSITSRLSQATSMDLFCFNYRLSPETIFPGQIEDALKAWDYLMLLGYGAKDIIIIGDSAGGNLALTLTLKLKENSRLLPAALVLYSPWTDMTMSGKSYSSKKKLDPVLTKEYIKLCAERYLRGEEENPKISDEELNNPLVSPLFASYENFPPVYIQVGTNEILYSDSERLYKKLLSENVRVQFDAYKGMWHVFQMTPFKSASDAIEKTAEFIFNVMC